MIAAVSTIPPERPCAARHLLSLVDRMQLAACGSREIDALVNAGLCAARQIAPGNAVHLSWSTKLGDGLTLLPDDHNFSIGRRDGVCWAWAQPNDAWQPAEHEARHDHPLGSGLIVARSVALALASAAIVLIVKRIEARFDTSRP